MPVTQVQWMLKEDCQGLHKNLVWRQAVRSRSETELNKLLYLLGKEGSVMVIVRDKEDLWTLFLTNIKGEMRGN